MYVAMRRTTIFLDDELLKQAQRAASRSGKSFAQLVREALLAYLSSEGSMSPTLPRIAGQFASGHADTASRVDELLWEDPHR